VARILLSLGLAALTAFNPLLCCCFAADLGDAFRVKSPAPCSAAAPAQKCCCCPADDESAPTTLPEPQPNRAPCRSCPCSQSQELAQFDLKAPAPLDSHHAEWAASNDILPPPAAAVVPTAEEPDVRAGTAFPFAGLRAFLDYTHILRC
jgi:hypothetical protein